jgi:uncharacterized iron-regulated protein
MHKVRFHTARAALAATALALALPLYANAASDEPALPDLTSYILVRNDSPAQPVTLAAAADTLATYDVIFIGEAHQHPGNHLAQMALFRGIYQRHPALTLSMEQFERDTQAVLDNYLAGKIGENPLVRDARAWSNYTTSYRPLVEFAKEHMLPVIAANAPSMMVRCVGLEGAALFQRLPPEKRAWAAAELNLHDGPYKDKFLGFVGGDEAHGGDGSKDAGKRKPPSASALRSFAAQVTRDDTMAESIALHVQKNPGRRVVHLNGSFHSEAFLGTVERLQLRMPNLKIAVVNPVFVKDSGKPAVNDADLKGGTFTLMLRRLPDFYANDAEMRAAIKRQMENRKANTCEL